LIIDEAMAGAIPKDERAKLESALASAVQDEDAEVRTVAQNALGTLKAAK
jgi:hypothetical protein